GAVRDAFNGGANAQVIGKLLSELLNYARRFAFNLYLQMQFVHLALTVHLNGKLHNLRMAFHNVFNRAWENVNPSNRNHVVCAAEDASNQTRPRPAALTALA